MEYCEQAPEMLRDNGRMYFLWEILDIRGRFLERKLKRFSRQDNGMIADARLEENRRWKGVLEQHKVSGQREILRGLLLRLGLSGEFVRLELETESAHTQELMEKLHDSMHMGCWDEVEIMLWQIEGAVNMGIPCNRQFIESVRAIVRWRRKEISRGARSILPIRSRPVYPGRDAENGREK